MQTILIKVDRRTVKRNPKYKPDKKTTINGRPLSGQRLKVRKTYWAIEDFTARRVTVIWNGENKRTFKPWGVVVTHTERYPIDSEELIERCTDEVVSSSGRVTCKQPPPEMIDGKILWVELESNLQILTTQSGTGPQFRFDYTPTKVRCVECRMDFAYHKLRSEEAYNERGTMHCDKVCPRCSRWWCCDYEFEELNNRTLAQLARRNQAKRRKK